MKDLPPLLQGRYAHGCSFYDNEEGTKVGMYQNQIHPSIVIIIQTYLVSGGFSDSAPPRLSSTELLAETGSVWVFTGELPSSRNGLRGANIDNKVLMTGN